MPKQLSITAQDWTQGIQSAHVGMQEIRGLNATDKLGVILPSRVTAKETGDTIVSLVHTQTTDGTNDYFADNNKIYRRVINGGTWSVNDTEIVKSIEYWKSYLFRVNAAGRVDYDSDPSGTPNWTDSWDATMTTTGDHFFYVAKNDKMYCSDGNNLWSVAEVAGQNFDPATGATYTITTADLDLPEDVQIICINEIGSYLAIGTRKYNNSPTADIYLWDTTSDSFNLPLRVYENGINAMANDGQLLYFQAGEKGNIYRTDGTNVALFKKMPHTLMPELTSDGDVRILANPHGMTILNRKLYFGYDASNQAATFAPLGIYSIDLDNSTLAIEHLISTDNPDQVDIGAVFPLGDEGNSGAATLGFSWNDSEASSFGVDSVAVGASRYTSDKAYMITRFYQVGTPQNKKTLTHGYIKLATPITTGDSLKLSYRTDQQGSSWTDVGTISTVGDQSMILPDIASVESIQFKVIINADTELLSIGYQYD